MEVYIDEFMNIFRIKFFLDLNGWYFKNVLRKYNGFFRLNNVER